MPVPDLPSISQQADANGVIQYLQMLRRRLNDFLGHLDTLNVDELDAEVVKTGTLDAMKVVIQAVFGSGASITFDGNGLVGNDGTKDTFKIGTDGKASFGGDVTSDATITGALIRTALSGARIEVKNSSVYVYQADGTLRISIDAADNPPKINVYDDTGIVCGSIYPSGANLVVAGLGLNLVGQNTGTTIGSTGVPVSINGSQISINGSDINSLFGSSLAYNSTTKDLTLHSPNGTLLSTVNLT